MSLVKNLLVPLLLLAGTTALQAQDDAESYFQGSCVACHTIGGGQLVGPDLKGVSERQSREWLVKFIVDPTAVLASGDEYAQKILAESNGVPMSSLGVTESMANALLDYIDSQSGGAAGPAKPVEEELPFTAAEAAFGQALFVGGESLINGGPACISCHNAADAGGFFGGGQLGPDLTGVFARLGKTRGLSAWLSSPASDIMKPIFKASPMEDSEIRALAAYFATLEGVEEPSPQMASFFTAGAFTAAGILFLFGFLWRGRFRATRKPMVEASKR